MTERNLVTDRKIRVNKDDIVSQLHEYDLDLINNHIYLFGVEAYVYTNGYETGGDEPGIEYIIANRFIRNVNLCMRVNYGKPIVVHMKSSGGWYHEGMAIYDTIKTCPSPVTILNYSHARSMTSIIIQAANKKVSMPNGYFMIHDGEWGMTGTVKQVRSAIDFEKRSSDTMYQVYVEAMREKGFLKNDAERRKWLKSSMDKKEDVYMTPSEAIEYGFIDEIYDGNQKGLTAYTEKQLQR